MKNTIHFIAFVLIGLTGILSACTNPPDAVENSPSRHDELQWDSPRLLAVQKEWDRLRDSLKEGWTRDNNGTRTKTLDDLLKQRLSPSDLRQLARTCDKVPVLEKDRSPFEFCLIEYMVGAFVSSGDRESLVSLLASRCPKRIYLDNLIEFYIVYFGETEKTLEYPILIFKDAYSRCKVPEVRRIIILAIRRAFGSMHIPELESGKLSDDEYAKIAMKWYRLHKDDLAANAEYADLGRFPLFTWKTGTGATDKAK